MKTVSGLFDGVSEAQTVVHDLIGAGFSRDEIGLIASDATGEWSRYKASTLEGAAPTSEEIGAGVSTGTVVGGLGGLLVGLTEFAIPGIGWVAAAGTLATTLAGAGVGAAVGGLHTAIDKLGVPKEQTGYYAEAVRRGDTLVSVRVPEDQVEKAVEIMKRHHAVDIDERAAEWRAGGPAPRSPAILIISWPPHGLRHLQKWAPYAKRAFPFRRFTSFLLRRFLMAISYTENELNLLASFPQMIGAAMTFAGGSSGLFGTGKEMFVSAQAVLAGVKDYPNNELIQAVLSNLQGDRSDAMEKMKKLREWAMARVKEKGINSYEKMRQQALEDCRTVADLLSLKSSSQEATEYKQWAMSVAEKVAMATTEGGFLGFGGERLRVNEKQLLGEIEGVLGVPSTLV